MNPEYCGLNVKNITKVIIYITRKIIVLPSLSLSLIENKNDVIKVTCAALCDGVSKLHLTSFSNKNNFTKMSYFCWMNDLKQKII